jgi:hypothetical protein
MGARNAHILPVLGYRAASHVEPFGCRILAIWSSVGGWWESSSSISFFTCASAASAACSPLQARSHLRRRRTAIRRRPAECGHICSIPRGLLSTGARHLFGDILDHHRFDCIHALLQEVPLPPDDRLMSAGSYSCVYCFAVCMPILNRTAIP